MYDLDDDLNNEDPFLRFFDSDDDDTDFEGFDEEWRTEDFSSRRLPEFTLQPGSTVLHPEEARPAQYFELIWGQNLWEILVDQTNLYAEQQRAINPPPPHAPVWRPVDIPTMKAFVGLTFLMGVLRLPARNDYWRTSKRLLRTAFNSVMPRDRFNLIWRYLHLQDNTAPEDQPDKLRKIRPLVDYLNKSFMEAYTPDGDVTVDETMVKFKGRLAFRQYLPAKPVKWGLKLWSLADSKTGYLHRFQIYTGKENNTQERGLTHRVVTDLMSHLQFTNVRVYMDNFYTSAELLRTLHIRGINACGTARSNRKGLPKNLMPRGGGQPLDKHEFRVAQKDDLTFSVWQDTKPVMVLSNFHDPQEYGFMNRRSGNPEQQRVRVPKMVADYQLNMKGVDLLDQMVGYYMPNHRSKKWWRRLFHHLQMASAYNSYVIAKDSNPEVVLREWPHFQDFVEDLAEDLIGDYTARRDAPLRQLNVNQRRHLIIPKFFDKKKVCHVCRAKAGPSVRVTATLQGCETCRIGVCGKCVGDHVQGPL